MEENKVIEKGFNLKVAELEENILRLVAESGMPAVIQRYVVNEIANKINIAANSIIQGEKMDYIKAIKENEKNKEKVK